ncbi:WD40 repeat-like protein, partial [Serendipita vermifera]
VAFSKPISESIPHIYISALPFAPMKSLTRQGMQNMFPNTFSVIIGCSERWPGPPLEWRGHTGRVSSIKFSSDGRRVVSVLEDCTLRLWDAETGQLLGEPLHGHAAPVTSVAFFSNNLRIVFGSWDKTVRLWDAETGTPLGEPLQGHTAHGCTPCHTGWIMSVAVSSDGRLIASASGDRTIRIWDSETRHPLGKPLQGHVSTVQEVIFLPGSYRILS